MARGELDPNLEGLAVYMHRQYFHMLRGVKPRGINIEKSLLNLEIWSQPGVASMGDGRRLYENKES